MREKTYFAVVMPLSPEAQKMARDPQANASLRPMVWSRAAEQLQPLLGKTCTCISPAVFPYGEPMRLPYGVALGGADSHLFLLCYLNAREHQELEIENRTRAIRAQGRQITQFQPDENTEVTVTAFRSTSPELREHLETAQRFFSNDITAAAGLYYLGLCSNYINERQEQEILSNLGAYALCVAELQPMEDKA